jgi:ABC-type amino acid transport substrate-binding protein
MLRIDFSLASRLAAVWMAVIMLPAQGLSQDLDDLRKTGELRHLGVPYANFVAGVRLTGSDDGFDVELIQLFAQSLGLKYSFVATDWGEVLGDLTGKRIKPKGDRVEVLGSTPVKGDVAANGITVIGWREQAVDFSDPEFPTQVWLIARADSPVKPIRPAGDIHSDIIAVKQLMRGKSLYCKAGTCLDPVLYDIAATGARHDLFTGSLNEMAPAIINKSKELTLLDVPDTLVALQKWPGQLKVIGPISEVQHMAVAFRKESPQLRQAFNRFLVQIQADGVYMGLVNKYYPNVTDYFPGFFAVHSRGRKTDAKSSE